VLYCFYADNNWSVFEGLRGRSSSLLPSEVTTDGANMAENEQPGGNNLDDFFAKKDKSKKKTKTSKFTVDDILQAKVENEEKSKKVRSSKKKEKDANRSDKTLGAKAEEVMFSVILQFTVINS